METSRALDPAVTRARLSRLLAAAALGLSLSAAPALAAEDTAAEDTAAEDTATDDTVGEGTAEGGEPAGDDAEQGSDKIQLAETPRDRVGLIVLGFLGAVTVGGALTAARQLRGKNPQASGEFRWR